MRIAVIGVGGVGSAACRFLARAGHDVVGFERFAIGHARGSSHGESRIIRLAYPQAHFATLMRDAYSLWDELEAESGESLRLRTGGLYFGPTDHPELRSVEAALIENAIEYRAHDGSEASRLFPSLRFFPGETVLWQSDAGVLRAGAIVRANARLAAGAGATLRENIRVDSVEPRAGGVVVRSELGDETFDHAIVTAGAYVSQLFPEYAPRLSVTRQQITYLKIEGASGSFAGSPVWIDADSHWYGFPTDGQIDGVKLARHEPGPTVDPDADSRAPDPDDDDAAIAYARKRLPNLSPIVVHSQVCLYTNTPDEEFLLESPGGAPQITLVSACSGHGFKFTVLTGKLAADRATGVPA